MDGETRLGLALGAGGASGLAHILALEAFEELGLQPALIAGTSIGAVFGALSASGRTAGEIRGIVDDLLIRKQDSWKDIVLKKDLFQWFGFIDPKLGQGGLIGGEAFLSFLAEQIPAATFEELTTPLAVVATDFWERDQHVFESGELLSAIQASMALPGLFTPVRRDGRILIDGGAVNPVPYDILCQRCQLTVAVDVAGRKSPKQELSFLETLFNTFQIMQHTIVRCKDAVRPPDIMVRPDIVDVRTLEFHKIDTILDQARPVKEQLKRDLDERLRNTPSRQDR
jgi:NTE family protein